VAGSFESGNKPSGNKMWEFSWLAEDLLVSQKGLCLMELVS
jgi:hypothetical protein